MPQHSHRQQWGGKPCRAIHFCLPHFRQISQLFAHCLMLDGVYRLTDGVPVFQAVPAPTTEQLQTLLTRIITRLLKMFTRHGALMEEDTDPSLPKIPIPRTYSP
ncbi:MAG: hypothetical protein VST67_00330, partial [Nitrospirota bacterium]|nr:hypothetical protein [Nitrospirota bacterium]